MNLQIALAEGGLDPAVVVVSGEVDLHTASRLREQLDDLVTQGVWKILLDLRGVDFIDSSGLRVLLGVKRRLDACAGTLGLVGAQPRILKILEITGLLAAFPIHDSRDEAIKALTPRTQPSG